MHKLSTLSVLLAGANLFALARAQSSDAPVTVVETSMVAETPTNTDAPSTVVITETNTGAPSSQTSSQPDPFPEDSQEELEEAKRLASACYPRSNTQIDWEAPCPAVQVIQAECTWGPDAGKRLKDMLTRSMNGEEPGSISEDWEQQPLDIQRACLCSSSFAEMVLGCGACLEGHGAGPSDIPTYWANSNATAVQEFTKLYCAADVELTDENGSKAFDILLGQDEYVPGSSSSSVSTTATATPSDRIGTATDVSLYFTPSVSSAYTVDMPTASSSADQTHANAWYTYTSLSTSDGLIVPTAFNAKKVTASPSASQSGADATGTGGSTATAEAGAIQTAMAHSGFGAGALGLAALAFAL